MPSMEESQLIGQANREIENNLSSVKIIKNSKGTTWEIKCKHEDPYRAANVATEIDGMLRKQYEK